jgi:PTH1 family peptidyl-tRNA hydrolase
MAWTIVGLGNPGSEYENTRHNVGREFLMAIAKKEGVTEWKVDKKLRALVAKGELFGEKVVLICPETFMNNSGGSLKPLFDTKKKLNYLAVVHDDLDLPLGKVKLSFGSGPGGHNGVLSIQKALKSKDFLRIRIGISPSTASGKTKKPDSEKVVDFVIGKFKKTEEDTLKKIRKVVTEALGLLVNEGKDAAMNDINSR